MTDDLFRKQYVGALLEPDPEFEARAQEWANYFEATEFYDRSLPGGWSKHDSESWIPRGDYLSEAARYAHTLRRSMRPETREDRKAKERGRLLAEDRLKRERHLKNQEEA